MTADECRPVEITVDDQRETIRVHGAVPMDDEARAAMGEIVAAARARTAAEHPHAGVIQELMAAWMSVRRQLPANDSRIGRDRNIAAVKDRMSAAIKAVRAALDGAS